MAKITEITPIKTSGAGHSSIFITLDNGVKGEVYLGMNTTSTDLAEGVDIEYDTQESPYGLKIKPRNFKNGKFAGKPTFGGGGGQKKDTLGMTLGNALTNATMMVCHDKIPLADLEKVTRRMIDISISIKKDYEGKI
jgi:hypothetical protein